MKRKIRVDAGVGILFVMVLALLFIVQLFHSSSNYSIEEKRTLSSRPSLNVSDIVNGTYQEQLETYNKERFLARRTWSEIKTDVNTLFGAKEIDDVYILDDRLVEGYTKCSEEAVENRVKAINSFIEEHSDLKSSFLLVPNAISIYRDDLPWLSNVASQKTLIDQFTYQLNDSILTPDCNKVLDSHKDEYIFYRSDSHWTTVGAGHVFDNWLQQQDVEYHNPDYKSYTVTQNFAGTLANKIGYYEFEDTIELLVSRNDNTRYIVTYEDNEQVTSVYDSQTLQKDPYTVFLGGNHPIITIDTNVDNNKRLLIFKDSFANAFIPFLVPYYNQIVVIDPRYYDDDLNTLISNNSFTDVMFLYNVNTFFSDTSLQELLTNQ